MMKSSLKSIDGPQVSLKSGRVIELTMLIAEYDKLLADWNPPVLKEETTPK